MTDDKDLKDIDGLELDVEMSGLDDFNDEPNEDSDAGIDVEAEIENGVDGYYGEDDINFDDEDLDLSFLEEEDSEE